MSADLLSVRSAAREAGDAPALVVGGDTFTFAQMAAAASELAEQLTEATEGSPTDGGTPAPVALEASRSRAAITAIHGLLEADVPALLLHPRWTDTEKAAVLQKAAPDRILEPREESVGGFVQAPARRPGRDVPKLAPRARFVVFTSGTSASPKGVQLSRGALLASARASARRLGWSSEDRWLLSLPVAHVGGLSIVTRCLAARRPVVLDTSPRFEAEGFVRRIEAAEVTIVSMVPTMLQRVVEAEMRAPDRLRLVLVGGARATVSLIERARELGWPTRTTYGLTEACSQVATQHARTAASASHVGPVLDGIEARIVDPSGEPASGKSASEGILELRGEPMFCGYLGEQPRDSSDWFATGDRARFDRDGNLEILERGNDLIVSGGENVSPAAVEAVLEEHPEIATACVVGLEDDEWGQLVAAVVTRTDGRGELPESLREHLEERLASFRRPRRFVVVRRLPENAVGKVDRRACRALLTGEP